MPACATMTGKVRPFTAWLHSTGSILSLPGTGSTLSVLSPPHQHIELDPSGDPSCIMVSFHALGPHFLAIQLLSILNTRCHSRFHSHLLTIKVNRDLLVNFASTICGGIYSHGSDPARCPNNPSHSIDDAKQKYKSRIGWGRDAQV